MDFSKIKIRQKSFSLIVREYYFFGLKLEFKPYIALCFVYNLFIYKTEGSLMDFEHYVEFYIRPVLYPACTCSVF
jgi:hypothetical protein